MKLTEFLKDFKDVSIEWSPSIKYHIFWKGACFWYFNTDEEMEIVSDKIYKTYKGICEGVIETNSVQVDFLEFYETIKPSLNKYNREKKLKRILNEI